MNWRIRLIARVSFVFFIVLPGEASALDTAKWHGILDWASKAAVRHTTSGLSDELRYLQEEAFEIVFVPGILGSRLTLNGKVIFGGKDAPTNESLLIKAGQQVKAEVLRTFDYPVETPIYGPGISLLETTLSKPVKLFGYDWRRDIAKNSEELHDFLTKECLPKSGRKKKVLIVAHSMGGLVSWHWKNTHRTDRPVDLLGLVVVGSPLSGSPDVVRIILEGYSLSEQEEAETNVAMRKFYRWVFQDANAALLTFPSVYELLPHGENCLYVMEGGGEYVQRHLRVDFWGTQIPKALETRSHEASIPTTLYVNMVSAAAKQAADFRAKWDSDQHDDTVYFLRSKRHRVRARYQCRKLDGKLIVNYKDSLPQWVEGDCRVPALSASHGLNGSESAYVRTLRGTHGDLLNDESFGDFVHDDLERLINEEKYSAVLRFSLANEDLRGDLATWARARRLVVPPSLGDFGPRKPDEALRAAIGKLNLDVLEGDSVLRLLTVARSNDSRREAGTPKDREKLAALLYESALAVEPTSVENQDLSRLISIRLRDRDPRAALAATELLVSPERAGKSGELLDALGRAQELSGLKKLAKESYRKAADLGHSVSLQRLERLTGKEKSTYPTAGHE